MSELHPARQAIVRGQLEQLQTLLAAVRPANRFYAAKLRALPHAVASLEAFSEPAPFTTKQELIDDQRAHPPYGTNLTYPLERYVRCHQTSGTTTTPLRWLDTPEDWDRMLVSWERVHRAAGVSAADRLLFAFSFGPFIGFWLAFESAARLGGLCLPGGGLSSVARLRILLEHRVTVLCCTPTYALRLAEVAAAEKIDLHASKVRAIIVGGEPGGSIPATRARLEELWPGATVYDHHGMTEVGPVTFQCPARPCVLHIIEEAYLPEVIDPATGRPAPPGHPGELVLTTLGRIGSPLLRYRTGDWVQPATAPVCACGLAELALEGGILGRTDDLVIVRGVNVYPSAIEQILRDCGGIAEYRVRVRSDRALTEMSLQIEPVPDCADTRALVAKVQKALAAALALRVPVTVLPPGTLPRFEAKAKRWLKG